MQLHCRPFYCVHLAFPLCPRVRDRIGFARDHDATTPHPPGTRPRRTCRSTRPRPRPESRLRRKPSPGSQRLRPSGAPSSYVCRSSLSVVVVVAVVRKWRREREREWVTCCKQQEGEVLEQLSIRRPSGTEKADSQGEETDMCFVSSSDPRERFFKNLHLQNDPREANQSAGPTAGGGVCTHRKYTGPAATRPGVFCVNALSTSECRLGPCPVPSGRKGLHAYIDTYPKTILSLRCPVHVFRTNCPSPWER